MLDSYVLLTSENLKNITTPLKNVVTEKNMVLQ